MTKDELLKKIREENSEYDPYKKEVSDFSCKIGGFIALVLTVVIFYLEMIFWNTYNVGLYVAITSALAVKYIIDAIKLKSKSTILCSVIFSVFFIIFLVIYIISFCNGWLYI